MRRYRSRSQSRTRGEYGSKAVLFRISWSHEAQQYVPDENGRDWGTWDTDFGVLPHWPADDVGQEIVEDMATATVAV